MPGDHMEAWEKDPDDWKKNTVDGQGLPEARKKRITESIGIRPLVEIIEIDKTNDYLMVSNRNALKLLKTVFNGMSVLILETNEVFKYSSSRNLWLKEFKE